MLAYPGNQADVTKKWQREKEIREETLFTNVEYNRRLKALGIQLNVEGGGPSRFTSHVTRRKNRNARLK